MGTDMGYSWHRGQKRRCGRTSWREVGWDASMIEYRPGTWGTSSMECNGTNPQWGREVLYSWAATNQPLKRHHAFRRLEVSAAWNPGGERGRVNLQESPMPAHENGRRLPARMAGASLQEWPAPLSKNGRRLPPRMASLGECPSGQRVAGVSVQEWLSPGEDGDRYTTVLNMFCIRE